MSFLNDFIIYFDVLFNGVECRSERFTSFDDAVSYILDNEIYFKENGHQFYLVIVHKEIKHCFTLYDVDSLSFLLASYFTLIIMIDKTSKSIADIINKRKD